MNIKRLFPVVLFAVILSFTMCSKDDDSSTGSSYIGEWHTNPFEFPGAGNVVMNFTFAENNFQTIINPVGATIPLMGVKGDIVPGTNNNMDISLTDLGNNEGSTDLTWYNRINDAQMFEGIYQQAIAQFMPKDFTANYAISGNEMQLIIPVANDTIFLYK
jgi:hypothetical protein